MHSPLLQHRYQRQLSAGPLRLTFPGISQRQLSAGPLRLTFPGISLKGVNIYPITRGIQTDQCVLLSEYCGTIGSPSSPYRLYLTVLSLCLFCDYCNCSSTQQTTTIPPTFLNFPDFSLISVEIPDFSRFSRCVATRNFNWFISFDSNNYNSNYYYYYNSNYNRGLQTLWGQGLDEPLKELVAGQTCKRLNVSQLT